MRRPGHRRRLAAWLSWAGALECGRRTHPTGVYSGGVPLGRTDSLVTWRGDAAGGAFGRAPAANPGGRGSSTHGLGVRRGRRDGSRRADDAAKRHDSGCCWRRAARSGSRSSFSAGHGRFRPGTSPEDWAARAAMTWCAEPGVSAARLVWLDRAAVLGPADQKKAGRHADRPRARRRLRLIRAPLPSCSPWRSRDDPCPIQIWTNGETDVRHVPPCRLGSPPRLGIVGGPGRRSGRAGTQGPDRRRVASSTDRSTKTIGSGDRSSRPWPNSRGGPDTS